MSLNDEVVYAQSNGACCGSLSGLVGLFSKIPVGLFSKASLLGSWVYLTWLVHRVGGMCLRHQTAIKTPDPETQNGLSWADTKHTALWFATKEKTCVAPVGKELEACVWPLWTLHDVYLFPSGFCSVSFAARCITCYEVLLLKHWIWGWLWDTQNNFFPPFSLRQNNF